VIPLYDFKTGRKNKWKDINEEQVRKIVWCPFTVDLINKLKGKKIEDLPVANPFLPKYTINIPKKAKLIPPTREVEHTTINNLWLCDNCKHEFGFYNKKGTYFKQKSDGKIRIICPNCGYSDMFACSHCNYYIKDPTGITHCPKCNEKTTWQFTKFIFPTSKSETHMYYYVGYVIDGVRFTIKIDEKGNVDIR
jgi:hypothetical protein